MQNQFDQNWYIYDDHLGVPLRPEASPNKEKAYILFYVRQDIAAKKVDQIYPRIEDAMFPGRPVTLNTGQEAYVVAAERDSTKVLV